MLPPQAFDTYSLAAYDPTLGNTFTAVSELQNHEVASSKFQKMFVKSVTLLPFGGIHCYVWSRIGNTFFLKVLPFGLFQMRAVLTVNSSHFEMYALRNNG
jgi:hypothetical protein